MREKYKSQKYIDSENEEKLNPYLKLTTIILTSVAILAAMWFWGVSILSNLDKFWKIFTPSSSNISTNNQNKIPPPPFISQLPSSTKDQQITVNGYSIDGLMVKLFVNEREVASTRADKEGSFTFFNVNLNDGDNTIYAKASDTKGLDSPASKSISVRLQKKSPKLIVSEPADRSEFKQKDNAITVRGSTDPLDIVTVNGQKAFVTSDGTFSYMYPLNDGENKLIIESTDDAGNKTTVEKTVTFSRVF